MTGHQLFDIVTSIIICLLIRNGAKLTERVERLERAEPPAQSDPAKGE